MTKFVLLGGYAHKAPDQGRAFYRELVADRKEAVAVLMCYFARPKEQWGAVFKEDAQTFAGFVPESKLRFVLADETRFCEQVKEADVVYFKGGETLDLQKALQVNPGWEKFISEKTVAGTSAGAEILAALSYNLDHDRLIAGYGLVPVKVLPHYESDYKAGVDWASIVHLLRSSSVQGEVVLLHEGEFKVFRK